MNGIRLKKNKSITLVSNNYWTLYKFRYDVVNLFIENGYIVNLVGKKDGFQKKFTDKRINKYYIPISERSINIFNEINTFISLYKIYKKLKTDLIFHFTIKPNIYGSIISNLFNIKSIVFVTGYGHIFLKKKSFVKRLVILMYKFALKNSTEIWFANEDDRKTFIQNKIINKQKTRIVPGAGVIIANKNIKYNNTKHTTFLMISRIQKAKGIIEFLNVAKEYKDNNQIRFILIGSHDSNDLDAVEFDKIQSFVDEKVITYHDYQDNIETYLSSATCLVHPSYREGLSTILVEAASFKKPIITTSAPGCIDVIPDETYGILCKPQNVSSLKDAIKKFLSLTDQQKEKMVNKTYNYVKNNFDRNKILTIYRSSLEYI